LELVLYEFREEMKSFSSFASFAAEFALAAGKVETLNHRMLEKSAEIIEERAKEKIGEYQDQAGPFAAWAPLAESTLAEKEALGYAPPDNPLLRTGEMRDSIEHKVIGDEAHVGSDNDKALWQELGTASIPPRSFLGGAAFEKEREVVELIGENTAMLLAGGKTKIPIE
jgi:hypothetical protein